MSNERLFSGEMLDNAWAHIRGKARGDSAGVDGIDLSLFEADLACNLAALESDLAAGTYRPQPYRAIERTKKSGGTRKLVIPTVRDRVAMTAAVHLLHPLIEPLLHPCSFAYRQGMKVSDALDLVASYRDRGLHFALRADIASFFDSVPQEPLFALLETAGVSASLYGLLKSWLNTPVADMRGGLAPARGLPQGLPISPLLANLYLTPFDRALVEAGWKLVRYADDLAVCCSSESSARQALEEIRHILEGLGLRLADEKTAVETFESGVHFLGSTLRVNAIVVEQPHPYEADYTPPVRTHAKPPPQGLPNKLMRTLYIQQQGSSLGCHGNRLVVTREGVTLLDIPAHHIDQIFIFGRIHITSFTMAYCLRNGIPVHLFSGRGRYYGALRPMDGGNRILRRAQFKLAESDEARLGFAKAIISGKLRHQRVLLQRHARNHPETSLEQPIARLKAGCDRVDAAADLQQLRGIEGAGAAAYYTGYGACFRSELGFTHRNRQPPTDPVNSLLSLGYTLLFYNIHSYLCARDLDPGIGLFHESSNGHPALVSDLMEELRAPVVDSLVLRAANRGEFRASDFYLGPGTPQPCLLQDEARIRFLTAFEDKLAEQNLHPDVAHPVDWRRIVDLQVARLKRFLQGATGGYTPFAWEDR